MKIVVICKKCKGNGTVSSCSFFKKTCPLCKGCGKILVRISDLRDKRKVEM